MAATALARLWGAWLGDREGDAFAEADGVGNGLADPSGEPEAEGLAVGAGDAGAGGVTPGDSGGLALASGLGDAGPEGLADGEREAEGDRLGSEDAEADGLAPGTHSHFGDRKSTTTHKALPIVHMPLRLGSAMLFGRPVSSGLKQAITSGTRDSLEVLSFRTVQCPFCN